MPPAPPAPLPAPAAVKHVAPAPAAVKPVAPAVKPVAPAVQLVAPTPTPAPSAVATAFSMFDDSDSDDGGGGDCSGAGEQGARVQALVAEAKARAAAAAVTRATLPVPRRAPAQQDGHAVPAEPEQCPLMTWRSAAPLRLGPALYKDAYASAEECGGGRGFVAAHDLCPGTLLLSERPFVRWPSRPSPRSGERQQGAHAQAQAHPQGKGDEDADAEAEAEAEEAERQGTGRWRKLAVRAVRDLLARPDASAVLRELAALHPVQLQVRPSAAAGKAEETGTRETCSDTRVTRLSHPPESLAPNTH